MRFFKSLKGKFRSEDNRDDLLSQQQFQAPEINYGDNGEKSKGRTVTTDPLVEEAVPFERHSEHQKTFAPPPPPTINPPASQENNPPPYQDWLVVPDNSQLPPPPAIYSETSPTNNASEESAERGHRFCDQNPVYNPVLPNRSIYEAVNKEGSIELERPRHFTGKLTKLYIPSPDSPITSNSTTTTSKFSVVSRLGSNDTLFATKLPLFFAAKDNPIHNRDIPTPRKIQFAVKIIQLNDPRAVIGIGFIGKPYPSFRQPGWHRSSLAVHADDGRRYINDSGGGIDFIRHFQTGDVITITMTFFPEHSPATSVQQNLPGGSGFGSGSESRQQISDYPKCRTRVDFDINDVEHAGWNVHEERDAEDDGIEGLQGEGDLYAAVGVCGACEFEVRFWPQQGTWE